MHQLSKERKRLTDRQQQVVKLLMRGCTIEDISRQLGMAKRTVKSHLNRIYVIFGITSRYIKQVRLIHLLSEERRNGRKR